MEVARIQRNEIFPLKGRAFKDMLDLLNDFAKQTYVLLAMRKDVQGVGEVLSF